MLNNFTNHYHHHVMPPARISLTLSPHVTLSFIASGRSSGPHPVSSHSCWMYVRAGRPAFARPYVGVHRSTSAVTCMSGSSNLDSFRDGRQVVVLRAILNKSLLIIMIKKSVHNYSWSLIGLKLVKRHLVLNKQNTVRLGKRMRDMSSWNNSNLCLSKILCFAFFVWWHINLCGLFNAKSNLVQDQ